MCTQDERMICFELCLLFCDIQRGVVSNFATGMFVVSKQSYTKGVCYFSAENGMGRYDRRRMHTTQSLPQLNTRRIKAITLLLNLMNLRMYDIIPS